MKYPPLANAQQDSDPEHSVDQLVILARALANEIETMQAEVAADDYDVSELGVNNEGIDFYDAVERYEIELIISALNKCRGNQTHAARLLQMKSTTLNAKVKHYGLNPVRSITLRRAQSK